MHPSDELVTARFAAYLRGLADWHERRARKRPRSARAEATVAEPRALADGVQDRHPERPPYRTFALLQACYPGWCLSEAGLRLLVRRAYDCAVGSADPEPDAFVAALVEAEISASVEELEDELGWERKRQRRPLMTARLERTRTPGIYKRGGRYVFGCVASRQKWESRSTLEEARRAKASRMTPSGTFACVRSHAAQRADGAYGRRTTVRGK